MVLAITVAMLLQPAASGAGITRTVLTTLPTLEAARIECPPGWSEQEYHGYDAVLVPLTDGMSAEVDGVPTHWARGVPILISRGAPHLLENRSTHAGAFFARPPRAHT